ncbi:hypothetical protein M404DRAFT_31078 [Pisolithus tinctorius Marx 270]|uniref:DH domain-containing protein n=1 Tax=Pisolithus tinctorius Marx 270 TaxID=870435 RepID=A0A0C3IP68_PISTI|nr:hypothetical protein M404DRAFT_31078 [Pisolithus tinctorius Marx 270]
MAGQACSLTDHTRLLHQSSQCWESVAIAQGYQPRVVRSTTVPLREPSARNLDLSSYLLVPMQCLIRHHLLIRQVLQYSDTPAPTPDLSSALQLTSSLPTAHAERVSIGHRLAYAEHILEEVNETIRDRESRAGVGEVGNQLRIGKEQQVSRLELPLPIHHLAPRKLLKEGTPMKATCEGMLRVLWSNIFLLLNESGSGGLYGVASPPFHNHPVPYWPDMAPSLSPFTNSKSVRHATTRSNAAHIRIRRAYPRCRDILVLRASNVSEARAWTEAIAQAVVKAREGIVVVVGDSRRVRTCHCWCGGWDTFQVRGHVERVRMLAMGASG